MTAVDAEFPTNLKTLPDDDPRLGLIEPDEIVLRRFNEKNAEQASPFGAGYRLAVGSLVGFSSDGVSIFRRQILEGAGLDLDSCVEGEAAHRSLASATVRAIEEFEFETDRGPVRPFRVVPDSYPPGEDRPIRAHVGHALITFNSAGLNKAQRTAAKGQLAATVFGYLATVGSSGEVDSTAREDVEA